MKNMVIQTQSISIVPSTIWSLSTWRKAREAVIKSRVGDSYLRIFFHEKSLSGGTQF